jgi:UDP:flavonoid glycosyltransferase YjiC (YdhE family)
MRIGMLTWGSHGDIRPFLALADGLQAAGHDVHLVIVHVEDVAPDGFQSSQGARITVLSPLKLTAEQARQIGETVYAIRNPMTQLAAVVRLVFAPMENAMFAAAQRLCADADLLIGHYFMHPLQIAAEHAGLPYVSVLLSHAAVPSAFSHPLGIPMAGKFGNRLLWWLTRTMIHRTLKHYPNRLRRQVGLPLTRDIVKDVWLSSQLSLVAVSPQICARQPDWPASIQVCGFLDMPNNEQEGTVTDSLARFLADGPAPVYMTFGSWMPKDAPGQTRALALLTDAARLAGCRAIIQCHAWEDCGFRSDEQILYVPAAPHHEVFPHCSAVVHHGGAGTTQSATLAGKPSIIVANVSEQEHWGRELQRLGIAGKPLKRRTVTALTLARQIQRVHGTPPMAEKARVIARAMRSEQGVAQAVREIEHCFAKRSESATS